VVTNLSGDENTMDVDNTDDEKAVGLLVCICWSRQVL